MKIQSSKTKSEEELNVWENSLRDKGANGSSSRMKFGSKKSSLGMYPTGKTTVAAIKKTTPLKLAKTRQLMFQ